MSVATLSIIKESRKNLFIHHIELGHHRSGRYSKVPQRLTSKSGRVPNQKWTDKSVTDAEFGEFLCIKFRPCNKSVKTHEGASHKHEERSHNMSVCVTTITLRLDRWYNQSGPFPGRHADRFHGLPSPGPKTLSIPPAKPPQCLPTLPYSPLV